MIASVQPIYYSIDPYMCQNVLVKLDANDLLELPEYGPSCSLFEVEKEVIQFEQKENEVLEVVVTEVRYEMDRFWLTFIAECVLTFFILILTCMVMRGECQECCSKRYANKRHEKRISDHIAE